MVFSDVVNVVDVIGVFGTHIVDDTVFVQTVGITMACDTALKCVLLAAEVVGNLIL